VDAPRADENLNLALAEVSIRTVRLSDRVPIADIVRFRRQNRELLTRYRLSIRQLLAGIRNSGSEEEVKNNIRQVTNEQIAPDLEELENKLREKRFLRGLSYLDITQACSLSLVASGFQNWRLGLMGGLVSLGLGLHRSRRDNDAMMREAPYGYLLAARKRFARY
jgi:glutathione S-transferase